MVTELKKPVRRKVNFPGKGSFVVTLTKDGITVRRFGKRKQVMLPYDKLAFRALEHAAYSLNEDEWSDPLKTLGKLGRLKRA